MVKGGQGSVRGSTGPAPRSSPTRPQCPAQARGCGTRARQPRGGSRSAGPHQCSPATETPWPQRLAGPRRYLPLFTLVDKKGDKGREVTDTHTSSTGVHGNYARTCVCGVLSARDTTHELTAVIDAGAGSQLAAAAGEHNTRGVQRRQHAPSSIIASLGLLRNRRAMARRWHWPGDRPPRTAAATVSRPPHSVTSPSSSTKARASRATASVIVVSGLEGTHRGQRWAGKGCERESVACSNTRRRFRGCCCVSGAGAGAAERLRKQGGAHICGEACEMGTPGRTADNGA